MGGDKRGGRSMEERVYEVVCSECDVVAKVFEPKDDAEEVMVMLGAWAGNCSRCGHKLTSRRVVPPAKEG
jgi:hypothetical protein